MHSRPIGLATPNGVPAGLTAVVRINGSVAYCYRFDPVHATISGTLGNVNHAGDAASVSVLAHGPALVEREASLGSRLPMKLKQLGMTAFDACRA